MDLEKLDCESQVKFESVQDLFTTSFAWCKQCQTVSCLRHAQHVRFNSLLAQHYDTRCSASLGTHAGICRVYCVGCRTRKGGDMSTCRPMHAHDLNMSNAHDTHFSDDMTAISCLVSFSSVRLFVYGTQQYTLQLCSIPSSTKRIVLLCFFTVMHQLNFVHSLLSLHDVTLFITYPCSIVHTPHVRPYPVHTDNNVVASDV